MGEVRTARGAHYLEQVGRAFAVVVDRDDGEDQGINHVVCSFLRVFADSPLLLLTRLKMLLTRRGLLLRKAGFPGAQNRAVTSRGGDGRRGPTCGGCTRSRPFAPVIARVNALVSVRGACQRCGG